MPETLWHETKYAALEPPFQGILREGMPLQLQHLESQLSGYRPARLCHNCFFVIPCKRSATRNPVLSIVSWIPAFAGMTIRGVLQSSQCNVVSALKKIIYETMAFLEKELKQEQAK